MEQLTMAHLQTVYWDVNVGGGKLEVSVWGILSNEPKHLSRSREAMRIFLTSEDLFCAIQIRSLLLGRVARKHGCGLLLPSENSENGRSPQRS